MYVLVDKMILFALCFVTYLQNNAGAYLAVPVVVSMATGALGSYVEKGAGKIAVFSAFCALGLYDSAFVYFLPLLAYDAFTTRWRIAAILSIVPVAVHFLELSLFVAIAVLFFIALSCLFAARTQSLRRIRTEYIRLRDTTKEFSIQLENKNRELLEKQDYEINLATLNERQRIARDIHDSIGHLLSNSILQTGALMATCQDKATKDKLGVLRDTLNRGMDSIRESIHDLHDESIDLLNEANKLVDEFAFCDISLDYDMANNPDAHIKYALIAVIKEGLSNIARHSNATRARVTLYEHPAFYQLIVRDNGSKQGTGGEGIGLLNIAQRVEALGGIFNINRDNGFTLFVNIPKEKTI